MPSGTIVNGGEAMGGIAFHQVILQSRQTAGYIILMGVTEEKDAIERILYSYHSVKKVRASLEETKAY